MSGDAVSPLLKQFLVVFTAALLGAGAALIGYDRLIVAPRLAGAGVGVAATPAVERDIDGAAPEQAVAAYRGRARIGEALMRAAMVKVAVSEYWMSNGDWPRDLASAGLGAPADHAGGPVAAIDLEPGGVIAIHLRDEVARGGVLRLHPEPNRAGMIAWHCRGEAVDIRDIDDCH